MGWLFLLVLMQRAAFASVGVANTELQWNLCPPNVGDAVERLELGKPSSRRAYFFDEKDGRFFKQNVLIRVRATDKKQEITVKIRNPDMNAIPEKFWELDFKCEKDQHASRSAIVCSLAERLGEKEYKELIDGKRSVEKVLSDEQKELLSMSRISVEDLGRVEKFGPIHQLVWKFSRPGLSDDIALEYSTVKEFVGLQYSVRVPSPRAPSAITSTEQDLALRGLETCAQEPPSAIAYLLGLEGL